MIVVLVGPTAVGKSGLALALADRLIRAGRAAEIVNADSMLVYRGMDIGTAKPSAADRARIHHHLVDIMDVTRTATVAEFQTLARTAIQDCLTRGVTPVLVGGSALYIRAVVDEFEFPGTDPEVRSALEQELATVGPVVLHTRLGSLDPAAALAIEPANGRRIVRALEVIQLTGEPYPASLPEHRYALPDVRQLGLDVPRELLDQRIADRVRQMWADGFVDEVRALIACGLREGLTASRALGYRQIISYLDGRIDEDRARRDTMTATRKFARRQGGWFRRDPRIAWLSGDSAGDSAGGLGGVSAADREQSTPVKLALRLLGVEN